MTYEAALDHIRSLTSQAHNLAATAYSKGLTDRNAEALADLNKAQALLQQAIANIVRAKGILIERP